MAHPRLNPGCLIGHPGLDVNFRMGHPGPDADVQMGHPGLNVNFRMGHPGLDPGSIFAELQAPQHFLYFFPLPQLHASLRPGVASLMTCATRGPMLRQISRRSYTAHSASP